MSARSRRLLCMAALALAVLAVYAHTLEFPFVYDDKINIVANAGIRDLAVMYAPYQEVVPHTVLPVMHHHYRVRPLPYLSFWANYKAGGLHALWQWRAVNIALHICVSWLVYSFTLLVFRMPALGGLWEDKRVENVALGAGLLYALHPLMTESVVYVSGRVGQMAALGYLGAVAGYMAWRVHGQKAYLAASLASALFGMLSKETAFTLPLMVILTEMFFGEADLKAALRRALPYLCLMPVIPLMKLMAHMQAGGLVDALSMSTRLLTDTPRDEYFYTQLTVLVRYVRLIFMPVGQVADYDWPMAHNLWNLRVGFSVLLLLALCIWAFVAHKTERRAPATYLAGFSILAFLLALSVESTVFPIVVVIAEYRTYLPMAFVAPAISASVFMASGGPERMVRYALAMGFVLLMLGWLSLARLSDWRSEEAFWSAVASEEPSNPRPPYALGLEYMRSGQNDKAIANLTRAIELLPARADAYNALGALYFRLGRGQEGMDTLQRAMDSGTSDTHTYYNYGAYMQIQGRFNDAALYYKQALTLSPSNAEAAIQLGRCLLSMGRSREALTALEAAFSSGSRGAELQMLLDSARKSPAP